MAVGLEPEDILTEGESIVRRWHIKGLITRHYLVITNMRVIMFTRGILERKMTDFTHDSIASIDAYEKWRIDVGIVGVLCGAAGAWFISTIKREYPFVFPRPPIFPLIFPLIFWFFFLLIEIASYIYERSGKDAAASISFILSLVIALSIIIWSLDLIQALYLLLMFLCILLAIIPLGRVTFFVLGRGKVIIPKRIPELLILTRESKKKSKD